MMLTNKDGSIYIKPGSTLEYTLARYLQMSATSTPPVLQEMKHLFTNFTPEPRFTIRQD